MTRSRDVGRADSAAPPSATFAARSRSPDPTRYAGPKLGTEFLMRVGESRAGRCRAC